MRCATLNGWWYGSDTTPVASLMRFVRSAAAARNISGEAIISQPLRMVLAAPEFVVAEVVEMLHQVEVAAELQHRVLADRMVRGEEGAEIQARHTGAPGRQ